MSAPVRVAVVHDWLTGMRGGEAVLEAILELFPQADLFTLIHVPGSVSPAIEARLLRTSFLQHFPRVAERYRFLLPLMPSAIEAFDLSGYDLIVSSSHCVAKGVRRAPEAVHLSYVHAPMRYVWDRYADYFGRGKARPAVRAAAFAARPWLRRWDRRASQPDRVDALVANSRYIAEQIHRAYGRDAGVVYPFAQLERFERRPRAAGESYLMVGAFAPYKRVDLAIEVFNELELPLQIVGGGQDEERLRRLAGPCVEMLGPQPDAVIEELFSRCRAFVFPGLEDFGITPLEAMASGAPVIAYGRGGAAETVIDGLTGILFENQTHAGLREAVLRVERGQARFEERDCRARAREFSRGRFQSELLGAIRETWARRGKPAGPLEAAISPLR